MRSRRRTQKQPINTMKKIHQFALLALTAAVLTAGVNRAAAQEEKKKSDRPQRGNFDPEAMRARMLEQMKERFEVTDDAAWKLISERIEKVSTAARDLRSGGGGFGGRPPGGGGPGGGDSKGRTNPFAGEPNADAEALQKALDAKATPEEIEAKLQKFRASRKEREAKLDKAQEELRQVLNRRQEATAVLMGLLK